MVSISYANSCTLQVKPPSKAHWAALKRLLRYLQGTKTKGLFFSSNSSLQLICYSDSDWEADLDDRRSTSSYDIFLGNSLISWMAKKQSTVSRSSTESEYKAIANSTQELLWLRSLLQELGFMPSSTTINCDNIGAIYLTSNPIFHARTEHIEQDFHFV